MATVFKLFTVDVVGFEASLRSIHWSQDHSMIYRPNETYEPKTAMFAFQTLEDADTYAKQNAIVWPWVCLEIEVDARETWLSGSVSGPNWVKDAYFILPVGVIFVNKLRMPAAEHVEVKALYRDRWLSDNDARLREQAFIRRTWGGPK